MKKKYIAPQIGANIVEESEILAGSETLTVSDDPDKSVPSMLSKDIFSFEDLADE